MKKVYIIQLESEVQFVFSNKEKALKQIEILKDEIITGNYFINKSNLHIFLDRFSFKNTNHVRYCFKGMNNKIITLKLFEKDLNSSYKLDY